MQMGKPAWFGPAPYIKIGTYRNILPRDNGKRHIEDSGQHLSRIVMKMQKEMLLEMERWLRGINESATIRCDRGDIHTASAEGSWVAKEDTLFNQSTCFGW